MIDTSEMGTQAPAFTNREDAGRQLAARLVRYADEDPLVLALPRGGVAVGYEVARHLGAPLDVFVARKIGAPFQPELGVGAVAPGGVCVLDQAAIRALGIRPEELQQVVQREVAEMERRLHRYHGSRAMPEVRDRTVILVDDGLATGVTAYAAVQALRHLGPRKLVLAVPVCAPEAAAVLRPQVDDLVCVLTPQHFQGVGFWYHQFHQLSDQQVLNLLERAMRPRPAVGADRPSPGPGPVAPGPQAETAASPPVSIPLPGGSHPAHGATHSVQIPVPGGELQGDLMLPAGARGLVLFAHGSGSSRRSPRNRAVARALQEAGLGTLLMDLLTPREEAEDEHSGRFRFDIGLLAVRVIHALDWLTRQPKTADLPFGLFGASTGAAAALAAAAERPTRVAAVVSRGGRPDLAGPTLPYVQAPTLLIVGERDPEVLQLNRRALAALGAEEKELLIVPGATHLFEESGALERVAAQAARWFTRFATGTAAAAVGSVGRQRR